ncbi:CHAT domain-containing protein [Sphingomonas paucimobilis]|nr:CHAT domain-containing protein [Sphingomonas paucimobilis]MCM3680656.1 CHAT domain-containing protein [Sphingomonas paucimobilis]
MLIGPAFTDTGVESRDDLNDYEVLHFATHGLTEGVWGCSQSPPALVTSFGNAQSDGLLSFSEIAELKLDANLVVLSACDTVAGVRDEALARSAGQEEAGATLEGLVRAFLAANARAVLATYWQVSAEKESDEFIRAFYTRARTGTLGEAMQVAQQTLIALPTYSHPFYWAPYFLVGDSSKTALSAANPSARIAAR